MSRASRSCSERFMLEAFFALGRTLFRSEKLTCFLIVFWPFWGVMLAPFGMPKWSQVWPISVQDGSRSDIFWKKRMFTKSFKNNWKINIFDPQGRPKMPQDRPKTVPRRSWRRLFSMSKFVFDFDPFWVPFWCHFGSLLAPFWVPLWALWGPKIWPDSASNF